MQRLLRFPICIVLIASISSALPASAEDQQSYQAHYPTEAAETTFELANYGAASDSHHAHDCGCCASPFTVYMTQTADYGTSLALPIGLSPANTLVSPLGNPTAIGVLGLTQATNLGLLDDLGLLPGPIPNTPAMAVFEDDFQFQTTAGAQYQRAVGTDGTFTANYAYYQNLHPDVEQLDLQSHTGTAQYAHRLSTRWSATIDYLYSYYFLDQRSYVSQNRAGGSLIYQPSDVWAWTFSGNYTDANFRNGPFLNSDNYAATVELTRYLNCSRNDYLKAGYSFGDSQAVSPAFAYQVNGAYVMGRWLYGQCDLNELRLTGNYGVYDFDGNDPVAGVPRRDEIWSVNAFLGRKISDNTQLFASYTYLDSDSNVTRQLYDSSLISIGITYTR